MVSILKRGKRAISMFLAFAMLATLMPTTAFAAADKTMVSSAKLLLDTDSDGTYDATYKKGDTVIVDDNFDREMNAKLIVTVNNDSGSSPYFWSTNAFAFSAKAGEQEAKLDKAVLGTAFTDDTVEKGAYYIDQGSAEGHNWYEPVFVVEFKDITKNDLRNISYEVEQYNATSGDEAARVLKSGDGDLGLTVGPILESVPTISDLAITYPNSGSSVAAGEEFTVTATTDTATGVIEFTYNGETKRVPVEGSTASAVFTAASGATKVTAIHTDAGKDSEAKTTTVQVDSAKTYTITVTNGQGIAITNPSGATSAAAAGTKVVFTVSDPRATDVTVVEDGGEYVDVKEVKTGTYSFVMPAANVTISAAKPSVNKVDTTTEVKVDKNSYIAGDVITATATVKESNTAVTDAVGGIVTFTWPDGTISTGYVDDEGEAEATWTATDAVADSDAEKTVTANFLGTTDYASSTDTETVTINTVTIKAAADAKILVDNTGSLAVNKKSELSLSENAVVNSRGVALTATTDYTVAWYVNTGDGNWSSTGTTVTPESTSYSYKAVISPKSPTYTKGGFELVVTCGTEDTSVIGTIAVSPNSVKEGQSFTVSATVNGTNNGSTAVSGGSVAFWAGESYLGEAPILNGKASLTVATNALAEGKYDITAVYSGVAGVYASAQKQEGTLTVDSAALTTTDFSLTTDKTGNKLEIGEKTIVTLDDSNYDADADYSVSWQVSKDGGLTWVEAQQGGTEFKITAENNLVQVRAFILPDGYYTQPRNGFVVGPVTCADNAKNETSIKLYAMPNEVFEGDSVLFTAVVTDTDNDAPVSGGTVTLKDPDGNTVMTLPVGAGGMVQFLVSPAENGEYTAEYTGNDLYQDSEDTVDVKVKSRTIKWKEATPSITVKDETGSQPVTNITANMTIQLTAPEVEADDGESIYPDKDFYYQWQYTTDGGTNWVNFADGAQKITVTVADSKMNFRVLAMPYGNYRYPASGLTSEATKTAEKLNTTTDLTVVYVSDGAAAGYNSDRIRLMALVQANGTPVTGGYVTFYQGKSATDRKVLGVVPVSGGNATLEFDAYSANGTNAYAVYSGTDVYNGSDANADLGLKTNEIAITDGNGIAIKDANGIDVIAKPITNTEYRIYFPTVTAAGGTPTLTLNQDYTLTWLIDDGSGVYETFAPTKTDEGQGYFTFTAQDKNARIACFAYPIGNYDLPESGVSAGVITFSDKMTTTTTLVVKDSDGVEISNSNPAYEGDVVTLVATVKDANKDEVLGDRVQFLVGGAVIGEASLDSQGVARMNYTLPSYVENGNNDVAFGAKYVESAAFAASNVADVTVNVHSASITFDPNNDDILIDSSATATVEIGKPYTLTAPEVYEKGNLTKELECGKDYYYIWEKTTDGLTWVVVQSDTSVNGQTLANAVFDNEETEFRATAYPMIGSGTIYRYPVTGITVQTSQDPTLVVTTTTLTLDNAYTVSTNTEIYPFGREITLKAKVTGTKNGAEVPASGKVTFKYQLAGAAATKIGSVYLNPVGEAEITIPAPAEEGAYTFTAEFTANNVFDASKGTNDAYILPNTIKMDGGLAVYDDKGTVSAPVVGQTYTLKDAFATVDAAVDSADYVNAVNAEHAKGITPYYYHQWQVSQDKGETWSTLSNNAAEMKVTFDSELTMYRLAAYPIASTGWINPASGVFSDAVGVDKADTETTVTVADKLTGAAIVNGTGTSYENKTVLVTVDVAGIDYTTGSEGSVELTGTVGTQAAFYTQSQPVGNDGQVTFEVVLPDYDYETADNNTVTFTATYSGDHYFNEKVGTSTLNLLSAAITWAEDASSDAFAADAKNIVIYEGTTNTEATEIVANKDYTLKLPAIYAGDIDASGRTGKQLVNGVDYTVDWQRQLKGNTVETGWQSLPNGNGGDTLYIAKDAGAELYSYRAVVKPMGEYTKAMDETFGTLTDTKVLTTEPTADTGLAETATKLDITNVVVEAGDVAVGADQPFIAVGEHDTQYEGETVTLEATVTANAGAELVDDGYVYFYRYVDGTNDVQLNTEPVQIKDGKATLTVETSAYDTNKAVIENKDSYYAVYQGTSVYETSDSGAPQDVYIRSTAIEIPRIGAIVGNASGAQPVWTTNAADTSVASATNLTFLLMTKNGTYSPNGGSVGSGFSVTATDGRWLESDAYTATWYVKESNFAGDGTVVDIPASIGNAEQWQLNNGKLGQKYNVILTPAANSHMKTGAASYNINIGDQSVVKDAEIVPEITFDAESLTKFHADVDVTDKISGSHYGDEITLTAYVEGIDVLPTGTVDFYYVTTGDQVVKLNTEAGIALAQMSAQDDTATVDRDESMTAFATFDTSVLPLNTKSVFFTYSGDANYQPIAQNDVLMPSGGAGTPAYANANEQYKVWSVQISNPAREKDITVDAPDFNTASCYPDAKSYGDVEISIYEAEKNGDTFEKKGNAIANDTVQANGDYILELNDVYTKSGEKLDAKLDNAGDISIEWFKSTDDGNTWSPVQVTELSDAEALTVYVKPETKNTKYMVKVTTNNSFYNSAKPELVDYEYSEEYVDVILQQATVAVTAEAETPVNGQSAWVYQRNPITLSATVTPVMQGEPSGYVEFYYTTKVEEDDYSAIADDQWTQIKDDVTGEMQVALTETDSATDKDGTMIAKLTTSELPVSADGTYSQLVIKAVYKGDQTFAEANNIDNATAGAEMAGNIASPTVHVFSSTANHNTDIQNQIIATKVENGKLTGWGTDGKPTDGAIIFAKDLVSDGTDAVLTLNGVFTRDADDAEDAVIGSNASIYTMDNETEYTVEWQYCPDYEAYKDYLENPSADDALGTEGKNWKTVEGSTNAMTCNVSMVQAYAFRAKITFNEEPQSMASYTEYKNNLQDEAEIDSTKVIYTNILAVGDAEARVFTNIRKASSASKTGDVVSIDTFVMGGSTTPVGDVTVSIYETGAENATVASDAEPVFEQTRNVANGYTVFEWTAEAGIYKIVTKFNGNNGYEGKTSEDYIVRFTDGHELDITGNLNQSVVYNGQVQMMDANEVNVSGFGNYTDLATKAQQSLVFEYTKDGQRVAEPVDAGTYNVKAYLPESKYWGYVEATGTFTIKKRDVEITDVIAQAKTYDGDAVANVQTVELAQSEVDNTTGLPTGTTGIVEGDSVYVNANAQFNSANVKEANMLSLTSAVLNGPDAGNYTITNPNYSEEDTIARNQLAGSIVTSITAPTGYTLTDDDFYLIDQSGKQLTVADGAHVTYYYHSGNDIAKAADTSKAGKYTVIVDAGDTANYKGGLTTTLYIDPDATKSVVGTVDRTAKSALIDITNTNYVYDDTAKAVTATATNNAAVAVEYAGADGQYMATAPVNAGRYMVKATANGATAYGIMTIVKGEPGVTISAADMAYNGMRYDDQTLNTADTLYATNENNDPYGDLYYTYVGGSIVDYSYNAPIDVSYVPAGAYVDSVTSGAYGEYAVSAHVPETANTVADIVSAEFQITKAPLTISAQEVYTRLFDTNSKMTSTHEGFVDGVRGVDNSIRDFIAMPTYTIVGLDTDAMNEVGPFTLAVSDVNVRNYAVTYEDNQVVINNQATQDALELRHELGDNNVVYYGQQFNVFLYGSRVDNQVNESSVVRYVSSDSSVATIDEKTGLVEVVGVGEFTITATRGDDETAIEASETFTAKRRYNDAIIARQDNLYDGSAKMMNKDNITFYYMDHGTLFVNPSEDDMRTVCTITGDNQTDAGEYSVTAAVDATKNVADGKGVLAIHRVNAEVEADAATMTYGAALPGFGYTATGMVNNEPESAVLADGVAEADARSNSDVGSYEILVAGGQEGHNYNVAYAKSDADHDFDITVKAMTFSTGTQADTGMIGETENWREHDGVLAGSYDADLAGALTKAANRVFGERNYVLDYETTGLIAGDSFAELTEDGQGGRVDAFEWLHMGSDALEVEAAANRENADGQGTIGNEINNETGTIHGNGDEKITDTVDGVAIDDTRYGITDEVTAHNYIIDTSSDGTQNIYQRPISMTVPADGILINAGEYTSESLAAAVANQLIITGYAEKLHHSYADLRLSVKELGAEEQMITSATTKITLVVGNTNYCAPNGGAEIEIPITVAALEAHATVYDKTATSFKVRVYIELDNGTTKPAVMNELRYQLVDTCADNHYNCPEDMANHAVLAQGTMTRMSNETVNGIEQAVYVVENHTNVGLHYRKYLFDADGYDFGGYDIDTPDYGS